MSEEQKPWELVSVVRDKDVEPAMSDICVQIARRGDYYSVAIGSRRKDRYENVEKFVPFVLVVRSKDKKIERRKVANYLAKLLEEAEAQIETLSTSNNVVSLPQRRRSRGNGT